MAAISGHSFNQHQKQKSGRGLSNEHLWQVWLKSVQRFQRRRVKCEKLTDGQSDIWSQASYRYPISWEAFFDPSDSYFLFAEERGYQ
jgi:hypothetical protein